MPLQVTKILRIFLKKFCEFRPRNVIPANNPEHSPDKQAGEISELRAQFCPKFSIRTFWRSHDSFQLCQSWHRTWVDGDGGREPKKGHTQNMIKKHYGERLFETKHYIIYINENDLDSKVNCDVEMKLT